MSLNTETLKRKMQEKNISQGELGRKIGVSQQTIFKWLHGTDPSLERFCQICNVLNVEPNVLLILNPNTGGGMTFSVTAPPSSRVRARVSVSTITSRGAKVLTRGFYACGGRPDAFQDAKAGWVSYAAIRKLKGHNKRSEDERGLARKTREGSVADSLAADSCGMLTLFLKKV